MSDTPAWQQLAEVGSLGALRAMGALYRTFGRRFSVLVLYPVAAYYFVRHRYIRDASREYLRALDQPAGAGDVFRHIFEFAVQIFDRMVLWGGGLAQLRMDHAGSEHLFALHRARRGALLLGAHLGSYDMPRQLAGSYGLVLNAVMFTAHAERINRFFEQLDPTSRVRVLSLQPGSLRTAFEVRACLDRGELVGILADRVPVGSGETPVLLPFLGREMAFPLSPFRLACMLGCPVLLSLCVRKGDAHYETVVRPIGGGAKVARSEREKAAVELARAYVQGLEEACLRHPYQWFNFYDAWEGA